MEFHEVANIFPMMTKEEFRNLVDDISENGLIMPIETFQEKIIDGRNRYLACQEAEVEPRYEEWDGKGDLVKHVVSLNMKRRHLNTSQLSMVAARLANMRQGERTDLPSNEGKLSQSDVADLLNISVPSVERANRVLEHGVPELIQAVEQGEVKVSLAATLTKLPEDQQKEAISGGIEMVRKAVQPIYEKNRKRSGPTDAPPEQKAPSKPIIISFPEPAQSLLPLTQYQKDKDLVDKVMWEATKRNVGWTNAELLKEFNVQNKPLGDARIYVAMIDKYPEMAQLSKYIVLSNYKELPEGDRPVLAEPGFVFDGFTEDEQHEAARMERFMLDVDKLVCDLINNPDNTFFSSWKKFSKKFGRVERTKLLLDRVNQLVPVLESELGGY